MTKDTEKAFKIIFCEYKLRRKKGFTKDNSICFEDGELQSLNSFSTWLRPDIKSALDELIAAKYLKKNIIGDITLTNDGIEYMESKSKDFFNDVSKLFDIVALFV